MNYRRGKRLFKFWCMVFAFTATVGLAVTSSTGHVDDPAVFEVDGNAVTNLSAGGDDWDSVNSNASVHASEVLDHTGVVADFGANDQIFKTGASKDISGINTSATKGWQWAVLSGPPDKDDLTNAYAVAYDVDNTISGNHELWAYFGTDRFDNSGDALLGFWFFQDANVGPIAGGNFGGHHSDGDVLVLASFTNGGATATINVRKWACPGLTGQACDASGQLQTTPLVTGAVCGSGVGGSHDACAITNSGPVAVPTLTNGFSWNYFNKSAVTNTNTSGLTNSFPTFTFFEGGVNLSKLFSGSSVPCFSKFLAETRSSTDLTKSVNKDFVEGHFNTCNLTTSKTCGTGGAVNSGTQLQYPVAITISSSGFGAGSFDITSVVDVATLVDNSGNTSYMGIPSCPTGLQNCTPGSFDNLTGDDDISTPFTLSGSKTFDEHFTAPTGKHAVSNDVHVTATVGGSTKTADFTGATCSNPTFGLPTASKLCATQAPVVLAASNTIPGPTVVAADVQVVGTVCNPTAAQWDSVTLTDNYAGALTFTVGGQIKSSITLAPGTPANPTCVSSNAKDYQPSHCDPLGTNPTNTPPVCTFTDTVSAGGTNHITGAVLGTPGNPTPTGTDTCHYCPFGFCDATVTK